jgi:hypothetical protein
LRAWIPDACSNCTHKTQRPLAIRVASAYRTVSSPALFVIARMIPWPLRAKERFNRYHKKKTKKEAKTETLIAWQTEWDDPTNHKGKHTKHIIPNIENWINRKHGQTDYYLTQVLSGHGNFNEYLYKMHKTDTPYCDICDTGQIDTPQHTILECTKYNNIRKNSPLLRHKTLKTLINDMIQDTDIWDRTQSSIKQIMTRKKAIREGGSSQLSP